MTKTDDEVINALRNADNPRTPLQFKLLDLHQLQSADLIIRDGDSVFHRTTGFLCGATTSSPKPISKMFSEPKREQ